MQYLDIPDIVTALIGSFAGSVVTILVLYATIANDKKKERKQKYQFHTEKIRYLKVLVESILKKLKDQTEALDKYPNEIKKEPLEFHLLTIIPSNDIKRLADGINLEDYYHSYLHAFEDSDKSIKDYKDIVSLIDYFHALTKLIEEAIRKFENDQFERQSKLIKLVEKSMDEVAFYTFKPELKSKEELISFLSDSLEQFYKRQAETNRHDLRFFIDQFVVPTRYGLLKFATIIPEAHYLLIQMKNALFIASDIEAQSKNLVNDCLTWSNDMSEQIGKLEKSASKLLAYRKK